MNQPRAKYSFMVPILVVLGLVGVGIVALVVLVAIIPDSKDSKTATAVDSGPRKASPELCKVAWRESLEVLRKVREKDDATVKRFQALVDPSDASSPDCAAAENEDALCREDEAGGVGGCPSYAREDAATGRGRGELVLAIDRVSADGRVISMPMPLDITERDGLALEVLDDLDKDGTRELLVTRSYTRGFDSDSESALLTAHGGKVDWYRNTKGVPITDVSDLDDDGRMDLSYRYLVSGGYEAGCGSPIPASYSDTFVAYGRPDGSFDFYDKRSIEEALKECPAPPKTPAADFFCARMWGFGTTEDMEKAYDVCAKNMRAQASDDDEPGCHPDPVRDECSYLGVWRELGSVAFPLQFWPPRGGGLLTEMPQETPGASSPPDNPSCPAKVTVAGEKDPSETEWIKTAGDDANANVDEWVHHQRSVADLYQSVKCEDNFSCYATFRYPDRIHTDPYKQQDKGGRPTLCRSDKGCTCTPASPCAKGRSLGPALRERVIFAKKRAHDRAHPMGRERRPETPYHHQGETGPYPGQRAWLLGGRQDSRRMIAEAKGIRPALAGRRQIKRPPTSPSAHWPFVKNTAGAPRRLLERDGFRTSSSLNVH